MQTTYPKRTMFNAKETLSTLRITLYYLCFVLATIIGIGYGYYFSDVFFASTKSTVITNIMTVLKLVWLIPLPYALLNFYSFIKYPVFKRTIPLSTDRPLPFKIYVRIVTRGLNMNLISETAKHAYDILEATLPNQNWCVEIVTDNPMSIDYESEQLKIIAVPDDYVLESGTKYKARALNYALHHSHATDKDWVIHLDEETRFDEDTIRSIVRFAIGEHMLNLSNQKRLPKIGQGVILYGKHQIVNWITTLADSIRVGDDYGRFRLQFEHGKAFFGMHGSFVVVNHGLEKQIGFDHGPAGNITEDAYFALRAQSIGVKFQFIHAYMYEKSPFSIRDFIKQRQRWFGGLWLCALAPDIPWKERAVMASFMTLWSLSWLCILLVFVNFIYPTGTPAWLAICGGVSFSYYVTLYLVGFLKTFTPKIGKTRFAALLVLQILFIPLFSVMEAAGVFQGLVNPPKEFYIVQKEHTKINLA